MVDQIYYGFAIKAVHQEVTEEDVRQFLRSQLPNARMRHGEVQLLFCRDPDPNFQTEEICVIVRGVLETLQSIRLGMMGRMLGRKPVNRIEPDFGILMMKENHCLGVINDALFLEVVGTNKELIHTQIQVQRTKFWSPDSNLKIGYINLVPLKENKTLPLSMKDLIIDNIPGGFYGIQDGPAQFVTITAVFIIPNDKDIRPRQQLVVVPKPPDASIKGLKKLARAWMNWEDDRKERPRPMNATNQRVKATPGDERWRVTIREVNITLEANGDTRFLTTLNGRVYLAMDIRMGVEFERNNHETKAAFRITDIRVDPANPRLVRVTGFGRVNRHLRILRERCTVSFWGIASPEVLSEILGRTEIPVQEQPEDDWEVDQYEGEFQEEYEEQEEMGHAPIVGIVKNPNAQVIKMYGLRVDDDPIDFATSSTAQIMAGWRDKPYGEDFQNTEFLIDPSPDSWRIVSDLLIYDPKPSHIFNQRIEIIRSRLNVLQIQAIKKFLNNRLSSIQGPPGTGKTTTASYAVAALHAKEKGVYFSYK